MTNAERDIMLNHPASRQRARLQQMFNYPGSKWNLCSWIESFLPPHNHFIEGFGGTLAFFLYKRPSLVETINDGDANITAFYKAVRDKRAELFRLCKNTPYARAEADFCRVIPAEGISDIERARRFLTGQMMSFAGMRNGWSRAVHVGGGGAVNKAFSNWHMYLRTLAVFVRPLRRAQIETKDIFDLLDDFDDEESAFYLDPPYDPETRATGNLRDNSPGMYMLDQGVDFHKRFVPRLLDLKGSCIVSGYDSPRYRPLEEAGWRKETRLCRVTTTQTRKAYSHKTECLWIRDSGWRPGPDVSSSAKPRLRELDLV